MLPRLQQRERAIDINVASPTFLELRIWIFLLPWGQPNDEPPPLDLDQAWRMARWAGHQITVAEGIGTFEEFPEGRYRLFLVEHGQPAADGNTFIEYRVMNDKKVIVPKDAALEVSF